MAPVRQVALHFHHVHIARQMIGYVAQKGPEVLLNELGFRYAAR